MVQQLRFIVVVISNKYYHFRVQSWGPLMELIVRTEEKKNIVTSIGTFAHQNLHPHIYKHPLDSISTASHDKRFRFISWIQTELGVKRRNTTTIPLAHPASATHPSHPWKGLTRGWRKRRRCQRLYLAVEFCIMRRVEKWHNSVRHRNSCPSPLNSRFTLSRNFISCQNVISIFAKGNKHP